MASLTPDLQFQNTEGNKDTVTDLVAQYLGRQWNHRGWWCFQQRHLVALTQGVMTLSPPADHSAHRHRRCYCRSSATAAINCNTCSIPGQLGLSRTGNEYLPNGGDALWVVGINKARYGSFRLWINVCVWQVKLCDPSLTDTILSKKHYTNVPFIYLLKWQSLQTPKETWSLFFLLHVVASLQQSLM